MPGCEPPGVPGEIASVHGDERAGHERGRVRGEQDRQALDLLRAAQTADGQAAQEVAAQDEVGLHPVRQASTTSDAAPATSPARLPTAGRPAAAVVGIDHSPQMLKKARATPSRVRWHHGDLADWQPEETPSLLFSNAVIHWLPHYRSLITRLWSLLPSGGCLALQLGATLAPMEPGPSLATPS